MSKTKIGRLAIGALGTNFYFVYHEDVKKAWVFDPADDGGELYGALAKLGLEITKIFLTHCHFDHILGVKELKGKSNAKVYVMDSKERIGEDPNLNCSNISGYSNVTVIPDEYIRDGQIFQEDGLFMSVISTPGHTSDGACYYFADGNILVSGDTLFYESVGRDDLPTGNMSLLIKSIREKLFTLPDDTKVFPGHGDSTRIAHEKSANPFAY